MNKELWKNVKGILADVGFALGLCAAGLLIAFVFSLGR